mmetsp:Transcript_25247/g.42305  ORF Transcript_25247/g.42305 Transcript_25247/m.42305 type:complete len:330 (-) Transcript_25247:19-1008(-)
MLLRARRVQGLLLLEAFIVLHILLLLVCKLGLQLTFGHSNLGQVPLDFVQKDLVQRSLPPKQLLLLLHVTLSLGLRALQGVALFLCNLQPMHQPAAFLIQLFELLCFLFDLLDVFIRPDDIFKVLQKSFVVRPLRLGLHHRDLLHFTLEYEEPVIVEVDAFRLEHVGDLGEVACAVVDQILGRVVAVGDAGHSDLAARDRLEVLAIVVDDVLEEYRHARVFQVLEVGRVVNQLRNFVQAELLRSFPKDEQHGVDDVRLPAPVGPNHRRKALMERPDALDTRIGLEVLKLHMRDDESHITRGLHILPHNFLSWPNPVLTKCTTYASMPLS